MNDQLLLGIEIHLSECTCVVGLLGPSGSGSRIRFTTCFQYPKVAQTQTNLPIWSRCKEIKISLFVCRG